MMRQFHHPITHQHKPIDALSEAFERTHVHQPISRNNDLFALSAHDLGEGAEDSVGDSQRPVFRHGDEEILDERRDAGLLHQRLRRFHLFRPLHRRIR